MLFSYTGIGEAKSRQVGKTNNLSLLTVISVLELILPLNGYGFGR